MYLVGYLLMVFVFLCKVNIMNFIVQLLKTKTAKFALLIAILSVLQGYVFLMPITPMQQMYVGLAISVIVTILRIITTQPVSEK